MCVGTRLCLANVTFYLDSMIKQWDDEAELFRPSLRFHTVCTPDGLFYYILSFFGGTEDVVSANCS